MKAVPRGWCAFCATPAKTPAKPGRRLPTCAKHRSRRKVRR